MSKMLNLSVCVRRTFQKHSTSWLAGQREQSCIGIVKSHNQTGEFRIELALTFDRQMTLHEKIVSSLYKTISLDLSFPASLYRYKILLKLTAENGATILSIMTFSITTLNINELFAKFSKTTIIIMTLSHYSEYHKGVYMHFIYCYAECHYADCHYAECHYAECHYAECHYTECLGAISVLILKTFCFCTSLKKMRDLKK